MKIWIVGAKGLLGSSLSELCQKSHLSYLATGKEEASVTCLETLKRVADQYGPTHIINCAAFTDVDGAENNHKEAFAVNAGGAENLGSIAREFGSKIIHISTDFVFSGCSGTRAFSETDSCNPIGVYAESKREGEIRLLEEFPQGCIVRTSWIFGKQGKNFISGLFGKLKVQESIKAVEDQLARATFCNDLAEIILALLCHSGVYHFANEGETSRYLIALEMMQLAKEQKKTVACKEIIPIKAIEFPAPAFRPSYSVLNTQKIEFLLGRKPRSIRTALNEFLSHVSN